MNVAVEDDDEVFEVDEEIEVTGAAAKSRAQVLSPDERKAELRARFAIRLRLGFASCRRTRRSIPKAW